MKIRQKTFKKARIEIIPMIDVIFFLLVFFMISSLSMTKMNSMPVSLPKTAATPHATQQNVILTIRKNGDLFLNKTPATLQTLGSLVANAMQKTPQEVVVVNADEGAAYGLVVKAMDAIRAIGVRKFALATEAQK